MRIKINRKRAVASSKETKPYTGRPRGRPRVIKGDNVDVDDLPEPVVVSQVSDDDPVASVSGGALTPTASSGYVIYGRDWGKMTQLEVELYCFREDIGPAQGGLGKAEHYWNIIAILWPDDGECRKPFLRQPWSERMTTAASNNQMLSISGCSGSGKTDWAATWAIVNWLCDPLGTKVMVTSTSLKASRRRIWGSIEDYWTALPPQVKALGKLVTSFGLIRVSEATGYRASERCGLELIPGEQSREKEATGKIIGIHNKRILLICDELPELSPALMQAAISNLTNNPWCQAIGLGNPASYFDAHGIFSQPKDGWKSINETSMEWATTYGWAIRFDATQSPNIIAGEVLYPFLPTLERLEDAKSRMGENSFGFYRQWRGFFPPEGAEQTVFSDTDIVFFGADNSTVKWGSPPVTVSGLDPGFTNGGDRSVAYYGLYGYNTEGFPVLVFTDFVILKDNASDTKTPRNFQIARAWKNECIKRGVTQRNSGVDVSGSPAFADIVAHEWGKETHRVQFGGKSSMWKVGEDKVAAQERYANRVTELYFEARNYMESGQLCGVGADLARELTSRRYEIGKGLSAQSSVAVEPKRKLKARTGVSPDIADAALVMFDLCRARLRFKLQKKGSKRRVNKEDGNVFLNPQERADANRADVIQLLTEEERADARKNKFRTKTLMADFSKRSMIKGGFGRGLSLIR